MLPFISVSGLMATGMSSLARVSESFTQQILEAPQQIPKALYEILERPKFHKEPLFQINATTFYQKNSQKTGVVV